MEQIEEYYKKNRKKGKDEIYSEYNRLMGMSNEELRKEALQKIENSYYSLGLA